MELSDFNEEQRGFINGLLEAEQAKVATVQAELDKLKKDEPTPEQKRIAELEAQLCHSKLVAALQKASLDDFAEFVSADKDEDIEPAIQKLQGIVEARKLNLNYQPTNHKQQNSFDTASKNGDGVGMLKSIFKMN